MFVQPSVARRSLHVQVVIQCVAWSSANYVRVCPQNRKLISSATLPRMTPAPSSLRVTLERMATAHTVRFFTTRTPAAESLNTCPFWRASDSRSSHKNRLDSIRQCPGAIVTYLVPIEKECGDRLAGLVVF